MSALLSRLKRERRDKKDLLSIQEKRLSKLQNIYSDFDYKFYNDITDVNNRINKCIETLQEGIMNHEKTYSNMDAILCDKELAAHSDNNMSSSRLNISKEMQNVNNTIIDLNNSIRNLNRRISEEEAAKRRRMASQVLGTFGLK
ncbi:MAG: hypothetical protein CVU95_15870 [Firmicutes bacterium HGW-Firmicutes-2]|jgi:DNA repair exonuclease SbcCD ATPase subunit|nr:MAG: hypothetical protein CVU95_15870 [Firmicutes bacterium HGW-Firmicutes-2]